MKFLHITISIFMVTSTICSPIIPSPIIGNGVSGLVTRLLPMFLESIEQFAPDTFEESLENIGLVALPERESVIKRKKRDSVGEMNQVINVITTLCNGAIGFANYAKFDDVAQMLLKIQPNVLGMDEKIGS